MNLGFYWRAGLIRSIGDIVLPWRAAYRPTGALFYLPIYFLFGMNPLPYRMAVLAILAINIFLTYRIAMLLTKSRAAATLAAILVTSHVSMAPLYYNTSMIYDLLAFFFTVLMLWIYLRGRELDKSGYVQGVIVIATYVLAINSKEIAVVSAAWVATYHLLVSGRLRLIRDHNKLSTDKSPSKRHDSMITGWRLPAILISLGAIFLAFRVLGSQGLSHQDGYRLELTAHRFFVNSRLYLSDLFYTQWFTTSRRVVVVWACSLIVSAIARSRVLWWLWVAASTAMLPVIFAIQPRSGGSLYLPLLAVALWVATAANSFLRRWPIRECAAAVIVALWFVAPTLQWFSGSAEASLADQRTTWAVITQIRDLPSKPKPGSRILFLENPFAAWDVYFISTLIWNDHTLDVELANMLNPRPDPAKFDWILTFDETQLRVIRSGQGGSSVK